MRALVTGATGFVGRGLVKRLDRPVVLSRDPEKARRVLGRDVEVFSWQPVGGPPPLTAFRGVDVVFHLAGESVGKGRWTSARKRRIRESRVEGTHNLVRAIESLPAGERPQVLVSASAIGYYGDRGDETLDETAKPGGDLLAEVCLAWEDEAQRAAPLGLKVVAPRIGIVLGKGGGALARLLAPFKLGLGGRLGSGRQWMSWIHHDDLVGLLLHAAAKPEVVGPMNAVASAPVTNQEFTRTLATVLHRSAFLPVPALALRVTLGELASVLLSSQRVMPRVAEKTGYRFRYLELEEALRAAVG